MTTHTSISAKGKLELARLQFEILNAIDSKQPRLALDYF